MSLTKSSIKHSQIGDVLLEAVVGMLIAGIVVMGTIYAVGRGSNAQYVNNLKGQIVDAVRGMLIAQGVSACGTNVSLSVNSKVYTAVVSCTPYTNVTASFPGLSGTTPVTVPTTQAQSISVSVSVPDVGGTIVIGDN